MASNTPYFDFSSRRIRLMVIYSCWWLWDGASKIDNIVIAFDDGIIKFWAGFVTIDINEISRVDKNCEYKVGDGSRRDRFVGRVHSIELSGN